MEKIRQEKNFNMPNVLTALRLILLPVFFWQYLSGTPMTALGVFLAIQATDLLDGFIARKLNQVTELGKLLDPVADKLLLLSVLICFGVKGQLPWWVVALVLAKEALMVVGGVYALRKRIVVAALWIGKLATMLFALAIIAILVDNQVHTLAPLPMVILYAAVVVTLGALAFYIANLRRLMVKPADVKPRED